MGNLVEPVVERLGWDVKTEDGFITRKLRILSIRLGGRLENPVGLAFKSPYSSALTSVAQHMKHRNVQLND